MKTYSSYLHIFLVTGLLGFAACKTSINTPAPSRGTADFSRYISVGNSLTAGYADNGLYLEGQLNSYPSIIAAQMQKVGGGTFTQPLFGTDQADGSGHLILTGFNADGTPKTQQVAATAVRNQVTVPNFGTVTLFTKYKGDINNYGVPGIKLQQITFGQLGNLNGYFERMLPTDFPTNTNSTYLDFVTAKPYTFFTDWLGNNDALLYATSGGAGDVLTDKAQFSQLYNLSITQLTKTGQKGAVATIPDVTAVPYFNTVTVGAILAAVQKANPAAKALYVNALVSGTTYAPRVATAADLIILTFPTSMIGQPVSTPAGNLPYGLTPYTPIDNKYVLDQGEVALTQDYVNAYNATIKSVASSKGLAIFDAYTFLNNVKANGLVVDGVNLSSAYISGGIFSLDGVHLTPRGYAVVANEFIKAINKQYNASIPLANVSSYRGVKFP
ncbi:MAG: family lipolytic protein [Mucilaginibacter sp.]|nr:family lipolytic protein [Mucilaginibacter sp.]